MWLVRGARPFGIGKKFESANNGAMPHKPLAIHVPLPDEVRGLYWTASTAGGKRGEELAAYITARGLNTVVIDLKMDNGAIAFAPHDEALKAYVMKKPAIIDLEKLLQGLAEKKIYKIARIGVMRDSVFADAYPEIALRSDAGGPASPPASTSSNRGESLGGRWRDKTGALWLDPTAARVAEYAVALGKEAYGRGFDEVQYDYVRFPSDGDLSAIRYPLYKSSQSKADAMAVLFKFVGGALQQEGIPVSFDFFGLALVSTDGIGVGQRVPDVALYADFISPMTYPSHYARGFRGHANPALFPYDVVKGSLDKGKAQLEAAGVAPGDAPKKLRPWLQDFDIGAVYTAGMIEAEIQAAREAGASGWLLWNARNVYEPAQYVPVQGNQ